MELHGHSPVNESSSPNPSEVGIVKQWTSVRVGSRAVSIRRMTTEAQKRKHRPLTGVSHIAGRGENTASLSGCGVDRDQQKSSSVRHEEGLSDKWCSLAEYPVVGFCSDFCRTLCCSVCCVAFLCSGSPQVFFKNQDVMQHKNSYHVSPLSAS